MLVASPQALWEAPFPLWNWEREEALNELEVTDLTLNADVSTENKS